MAPDWYITRSRIKKTCDGCGSPILGQLEQAFFYYRATEGATSLCANCIGVLAKRLNVENQKPYDPTSNTRLIG